MPVKLHVGKNAMFTQLAHSNLTPRSDDTGQDDSGWFSKPAGTAQALLRRNIQAGV